MSLHIVPVGDVVEHTTTDGCVCGPTDQPVKRDDGSVRWLVVHHSADDRETRERSRTCRSSQQDRCPD